MTSPFSADEQTTAEMAAEQLVAIARRQRRRLTTAHWGARLAMTAVIVWAFGQPDAVDLGPLVFSLAAVGGTAVIGNRRLLDARPGPVVRAWIATALLGILAIAGRSAAGIGASAALGALEALSLRLHWLACGGCRRFRDQQQLMRQALDRWKQYRDGD